ncbi:MAG: hypothetical protein ACM3QZ_00120 [Solirubrobacterales bacterium]
MVLPNERERFRERVKRLIAQQRNINEHVYLLFQENRDEWAGRELSEAINHGHEILACLIRLIQGRGSENGDNG